METICIDSRLVLDKYVAYMTTGDDAGLTSEDKEKVDAYIDRLRGYYHNERLSFVKDAFGHPWERQTDLGFGPAVCIYIHIER